MEDRKKKRKSRSRLIVLILGAAALLTLAVVLILNGGIGGTIRALKGEPAKNYYYEHHGKTAYAAVGRSFAVLDPTELKLWNEQGESVYSALLSFKTPELSFSGEYAAAWDIGGSEVLCINESGLAYRFSETGRIISVSINSKGYAAVCTEETGYGGAVTVYNPKGRALYKVYSGSKYVLNAKVNDTSEVAVLGVGAGESEITLYKVTEENPKAKYSFPGLILDFNVNDGGYAAITQDRVIFLDRNLSERATFSFEGRYLASYDIKKDITAVIIGEYQLGGAHEIVTLENDGSVIARTVTNEEIEWFAMGERTAALFSPGKIEIFTYRLEPKESVAPPAGTEKVLFRDDGALLAVGPYSTELIELGDKKQAN